MNLLGFTMSFAPVDYDFGVAANYAFAEMSLAPMMKPEECMLKPLATC